MTDVLIYLVHVHLKMKMFGLQLFLNSAEGHSTACRLVSQIPTPLQRHQDDLCMTTTSYTFYVGQFPTSFICL